MRKLSKLKLKEFQEMSRFEMKNVVGGYTESSWCHEGEYLFHCVADFVGPVYGDPERLPAGKAVPVYNGTENDGDRGRFRSAFPSDSAREGCAGVRAGPLYAVSLRGWHPAAG